MCKCVTFSFLLAHVALILYIIALATNYWFLSDAPNTNVKYHKGLWEVCSDTCDYGAEYKYNTTEVQTYYRVAQFFYGFATGNCAFGVVLLYFAMMSTKLHSSVCLSGFVSLLLGISGLEGATAVILLGSYFKQDKGFPDGYTDMFGWSYYVALASVVVAFVAMLANVRHNCTMRTEARQQGYEKV